MWWSLWLLNTIVVVIWIFSERLQGRDGDRYQADNRSEDPSLLQRLSWLHFVCTRYLHAVLHQWVPAALLPEQLRESPDALRHTGRADSRPGRLVRLHHQHLSLHLQVCLWTRSLYQEVKCTAWCFLRDTNVWRPVGRPKQWWMDNIELDLKGARL